MTQFVATYTYYNNIKFLALTSRKKPYKERYKTDPKIVRSKVEHTKYKYRRVKIIIKLKKYTILTVNPKGPLLKFLDRKKKTPELAPNSYSWPSGCSARSHAINPYNK